MPGGQNPPSKPPDDIKARRTRGGTGAGGRVSFPGGGGLDIPMPGGGPGGGISATPISRTIPPPHWIRPPRAGEINVDTSGTGFNNANTPATFAGSVFQVPQDNVGVIRAVTLSINNLTATSAVIWAIRQDGVPIQGWNALTIFPRLAASVSISYGPDETFIPIDDGALLDVQIIVAPADGNTYQIGVSYHGWYYSKQLAEAFESIYRP